MPVPDGYGGYYRGGGGDDDDSFVTHVTVPLVKTDWGQEDRGYHRPEYGHRREEEQPRRGEEWQPWYSPQRRYDWNRRRYEGDDGRDE